jgi:hypothetical protein
MRAHQPVIHAQAGRWIAYVGHHEVDDRGHLYIVDRANTGMHILQFQR